MLDRGSPQAAFGLDQDLETPVEEQKVLLLPVNVRKIKYA